MFTLFYVLFLTTTAVFLLTKNRTLKNKVAGLELAYKNVSNDYVKYNRQAKKLATKNASLLKELGKYQGNLSGN